MRASVPTAARPLPAQLLRTSPALPRLSQIRRGFESPLNKSTLRRPLDGERKTVTALFADIKGSTELMEDLDPEEARAIVDPALKLMIDAVHRYDGYVVQSTGDGIFALFGAPVAHEDHPQRALYAALRMQEDMRALFRSAARRGSLPIEIRVGRQHRRSGGPLDCDRRRADRIHTDRTYHQSRLADADARADRLDRDERADAQTGRGLLRFKPLGPTKVKGVSEPVNVYEVTGLGPLRTRLQTFGGARADEVRRARARDGGAQACAPSRPRRGHGQIVAAMAEAGVGKSRLFFEFKAIAQSGGWCWRPFRSRTARRRPICR